MTKLTKTILARIWWLGRGTATLMGVAVMLALTVGLTSTALAGTGIGARFDLGKTNVVNAATKLTGSLAGASLRIDNNSTRVGATALDLQVEPGKPPMTVNSPTKVEGLNADSLDGRDFFDFALRDPETGAAFAANEAVTALSARNADKLDNKDSTEFAIGTGGKANDANLFDGKDSAVFFSGKTYASLGDALLIPIGRVHTVRESCDPGDVALSGGYRLATSGISVARSEITLGSEHVVEVAAPHDTSVTALATVTCADFPPLR